mgnify:CR=1 FL=1
MCLCAAVRAAGVIREYQRVEGASAVPPDFRFVGGLDLQPENGRRAAQPAAGPPRGRAADLRAAGLRAAEPRIAELRVAEPRAAEARPEAGLCPEPFFFVRMPLMGSERYDRLKPEYFPQEGLLQRFKDMAGHLATRQEECLAAAASTAVASPRAAERGCGGAADIAARGGPATDSAARRRPGRAA